VNPLLAQGLVIAIPSAIAILLTLRTNRALGNERLIGQASPGAFRWLLISRAIYWIVFGMLITAFTFERIIHRTGGEATRAAIAHAHNPESEPFIQVINTWGIVLVPASLVTIFIALGALFWLGKKGLGQLSDEEFVGSEFKRARAHFFFIGFSLMLPPLFFSLLFSF
jgi:nitrogen fixation-related uncharacterized protein